MKALAALFVLFGLSSTAKAQSNSSDNSLRSKVTFEDARQKLKGFSAVAYYNFSDRNSVKLGQETYETKSQGTVGFGGQYQYSLSPYMQNKAPVSVIGGLVYETPRDLKAVNVQGTSFQTGVAKPNFSLVMLYSNLDYVINEQVSLFGGLNFPIPFESNFNNVRLEGTIGFQGGLTMNVAKSFATDLSYRWVNLTGNNGLNRIDVDGFLLNGRYIF